MAIELQTKVSVAPTDLKITHESRLLLMGSCFSDAMGERMRDCGFNVMSNPFGTLYNPLSIAECIRRTAGQVDMTADDVVFHNGLWHSWLHHGRFSSHDRNLLLADCTDSMHKLHLFMKQPMTVVFTFGTAYVFRHGGRVVSNCHKLPASLFERTRLNVDEIVEVWHPMLREFASCGHKVVFTVSPIRHMADGAHGNQLSKATLLLAVERLCEEGWAEYFPAYEIVLDELRDYRFYTDDMTHPSQLAEEIVWQRFQETYMSSETIERSAKYQKLSRMKKHRPLHTDSAEYEQYMKKLAELEEAVKVNG